MCIIARNNETWQRRNKFKLSKTARIYTCVKREKKIKIIADISLLQFRKSIQTFPSTFKNLSSAVSQTLLIPPFAKYYPLWGRSNQFIMDNMAGTFAQPKVLQTRRAVFAASHRLHSIHLTDEENLRVYGKCNHPNGHGHNYVVEVTLFGKINPKTGMVVNMTELKGYIKHAVMDTMDHKNLDKDVAFFQSHPSTVENVAVFIWNSMKRVMAIPDLLHSVKVYETENNIVVFKGN